MQKKKGLTNGFKVTELYKEIAEGLLLTHSLKVGYKKSTDHILVRFRTEFFHILADNDFEEVSWYRNKFRENTHHAINLFPLAFFSEDWSVNRA